jgi:hypothetical protein
MDAIIAFLIEKFPVIAIICIAITAMVVWWEAKLFHGITRIEENMAAMRIQIADIKTELQACATKTELQQEILKLKENDFFHLGKAILLIGTEVLKNNPERFARVKDTVMENTPEGRRGEITAIVVNNE